MKMDEELVIKYIRTKNKVRKIVTYKENSELRIYHQKVVEYWEYPKVCVNLQTDVR